MRFAVLVAAVAACSAPVQQQKQQPVDIGVTVTQPPDAPPPDPTPPAFRLPVDVAPVRAALDLQIVPTVDRVVGTAHYDATIANATRVVWLHAQGLKIGAALIDGKPVRVVTGESLVGLVAPRELAAGASIAIDIPFEATIDRAKSRGIYSETEGNEAYVYTFFEAIDARRAFPCFDEPRFKIPWQLTFHVRRTDVARGNAPIAREIDEPNDMKRVELVESRPLPSYLVAFVVGPFDVIDDGLAGRIKTPVAFIVPKGRSGELDYAKEITPKVVVALEDYFDMDYPYGKLDVAVVPRFWGTMEHPGIVAMGQPLTLIRPEQRTHERERGYTNILAHEMSHYWFGDLVTLAWWDDAWLNESLGEWSDMNITDAVAPQWHYRDTRVGLATDAMSADETLSAAPIHHPVTSVEQIETAFDGQLTYAKGSSVLRECEALAGPERFRDFIRAYVKKHAWGNVTAHDFVSDLRAMLGPQIADTLETHITRPGVPLVRVTPDCSGPTAKLAIDESRRALPFGVTEAADDQHVWAVPVCVRYGDATHSERACRTDGSNAPIDVAFKTCPTWVLPNADANFYYRSQIDPATVVALFDPRSAIAKSAKPSTAEKLMAIADLRAGVTRGELEVDKVLAVVPAILADADARVQRGAAVAATFRFDALDDALYEATGKWYLRVFGKAAHALGWKHDKADSDDRRALRQQVMWRVGGRDPVLRAQAEKLAARWLTDRSGIDDDMVEPVLMAAARRGNAALFDRVLAAAKAPRDRGDAQRLLQALAWFTDPALAQRALDLALGKDFDPRETIAIVQNSLAMRETRELALTFVQQHVDELLGRMRGDEASWVVGQLASAFCDAPHRKLVGELLAPRAAKIDGGEAAVARGLEQSDQCIAELARERPALERFLKK